MVRLRILREYWQSIEKWSHTPMSLYYSTSLYFIGVTRLLANKETKLTYSAARQAQFTLNTMGMYYIKQLRSPDADWIYTPWLRNTWSVSKIPSLAHPTGHLHWSAIIKDPSILKRVATLPCELLVLENCTCPVRCSCMAVLLKDELTKVPTYGKKQLYLS